jgi:hypothetical protein
MTVTMMKAPFFENPFGKTAFFHRELMKEGKVRESVNLVKTSSFPS